MKLDQSTWNRLSLKLKAYEAGSCNLGDFEADILRKVMRWYGNAGANVDIPSGYVDVLEDMLSLPRPLSGSSEVQFNRYPYEDQGGTSYYQKKGWAINKPKRK